MIGFDMGGTSTDVSHYAGEFETQVAGVCMRAPMMGIHTVIRENAGTMQPGDVYVLNDPHHGGTHLPDITVITPVYLHAHQRAVGHPRRDGGQPADHEQLQVEPLGQIGQAAMQPGDLFEIHTQGGGGYGAPV